MMGDLIRRSELLSVFKRWERVPDYNDAERHIIKAAIYEAENIPAVDAVEVVRCESCDMANDCSDEREMYCSLYHAYKPIDYFCADGRRKEAHNGE